MYHLVSNSLLMLNKLSISLAGIAGALYTLLGCFIGIGQMEFQSKYFSMCMHLDWYSNGAILPRGWSCVWERDMTFRSFFIFSGLSSRISCKMRLPTFG